MPTPEEYREIIRRESARLASVARAADLTADVPTCPGWTASDVVEHTAGVYGHKVAAMRAGGERPTEWPVAPAEGQTVVEWFDEQTQSLLDELASHDPSATAWTWWPPEQTVGFWHRRMALEVAVHRLDVEDAAGTPTPIDADVAVDGIDEVLERFLGGDWSEADEEDWDGVSPDAGAGATMRVHAGGEAWRVTLQPDVVMFEHGDGAADVTVSGDPGSVLLWLYRRRGDDAVTVEGDAAVVQAFRDRLRIATT